jgi:hypothetical protein
MKRLVIRLNNWLTRRKARRVKPSELLILSPRCLQNSDCRQGIVSDPGECLSCGRCDVKDLVAFARRRGLRLVFATGGGLARERLRDQNVRAVVAIACEKELFAGILAKRSKPVLAVTLSRPRGPCRDTRVSLPEVETAARHFLGEERGR